MPWKSPCGPMDKDHIDTTNRPLPTPNPDGDWIRLLVIVLEEINDDFIELKRLYYLDKQGKSQSNPCGHLDSDFQHLIGFPTADSTWINNPAELNANFLEILDDYQKLASILVFVEQIVWENDTVGDRNDRDYLCNIYRKIKDALCEIRSHSQKTLINKVTPTRNAMHLEYRLIDNRTTRFQRNYIIFKDASRYLRAISSKYIRLYFQS
ncbi:unnamed protein product [Mytilus edulis]|uniref:Uncharacterized protein n=1 Tax=Mytilus edulis TaxID=6550 RepID=A0A8S3SAU0_MYTED|nr:unnamed protein product [Mytilus edulis]